MNWHVAIAHKRRPNIYISGLGFSSFMQVKELNNSYYTALYFLQLIGILLFQALKVVECLGFQ